MTTHPYLFPGLAAILAAVLTPIYWTLEFGYAVTAGEPRGDWGALDVLAIALGILQIYLYVSLKQILHDHHEYRRTDVILNILIGSVVVYHVLMQFVGVFGSEAAIVTALAASTVLVGILDVVLAVLLLGGREQFPSTLTIFALATLIMGIFEVTLLFSVAVPYIYPLTAIALAVHFLKKPETVEFV